MVNFLKPRTLSSEAKVVYNAGLAIWRHYFTKQGRSDFDHNAGFYEIKEFFRGRNEKVTLQSKGSDETFETLTGNLSAAYKPLAEKLAKKCYEHGFLSVLKPDTASRRPDTEKGGALKIRIESREEPKRPAGVFYAQVRQSSRWLNFRGCSPQSGTKGE